MKFYPFNEAKSTRVYRDLNLNLSQNPITNDVTSVTDFNAVKRSIKNLLAKEKHKFKNIELNN